MTTPAPQPGLPPAAVCTLCGAALADGTDRCGMCGLYQAGPDRPNPFTRAGLWLLVGVIVAVYAVALLVVAAAR